VIESIASIRREYAHILDEIAELDHAQTAEYAGYASLAVLLAEVLHLNRVDTTRMVTQSELVSETVTPIGYTAPANGSGHSPPPSTAPPRAQPLDD